MALEGDWIFKSALKNTRHKVNFFAFQRENDSFWVFFFGLKKNQGHVIMIFFHKFYNQLTSYEKKRTQYLKIILLLNS